MKADIVCTDVSALWALVFSKLVSLHAYKTILAQSRPQRLSETKRKLQQFTVSGWLIIYGERVIVKKENFKAEIIFNMKCPYNYQPLFA